MSEVNVTVADGKIVCTPDVVQVTKVSNNRVTFLLKTAGYTFPAKDAIVLKKPSSDFPDPARTVGDTQVELRDLNRTKGLYAYAVTVLDGKGQPIEVDPGIENDGSGPT